MACEVERAVVREVIRLGARVSRKRSAGSSIERAVRTGVCARNSASVFAMRTEQLLCEHGGPAAFARAQLCARALTLEDGFEWIRRLGAHADALQHFERTGGFEPQLRTPDVIYAVGQLVAHKHFHVDASNGTGVIYGWTSTCEASVGSHDAARFVDNRRTFARIDAAGGRLRQPFYRLLTRGGESRLVAQELLQPLGARDACADRPVQGASFFFVRIARRGLYEPNGWLRALYPQ
ncbi:hypothetical protein KFE25_005347 [Diacronema lutheri]|uniref:Hemimethylated DNA-binding domain-containing protein n=1 Tax=Diacronema lutheri TaxID=2081491 RepID=A0A8J5XJZ7_DIALT|nr:hypothetical protein KFE25_005347 [Diacronema lutheri]